MLKKIKKKNINMNKKKNKKKKEKKRNIYIYIYLFIYFFFFPFESELGSSLAVSSPCIRVDKFDLKKTDHQVLFINKTSCNIVIAAHNERDTKKDSLLF